MEKADFLIQVSDRAQCDPDTAAAVYQAVVEVMADVLSSGESVELLPEFASFRVKRSDNPGRSDASPRTPRTSHYTVSFRAGAALKKRLKIL